MSQNIQTKPVGDGKTYDVNMRGKSFIVILDAETASYEIKGEPPEEVKNSSLEFIEWFVKKLGVAFKTGNIHPLN